MFYQKRRYVLLKTEVRLKQVDKTILKLVYGISVMSLHLHYFPADGKRCMEEAGEIILEEDEDL